MGNDRPGLSRVGRWVLAVVGVLLGGAVSVNSVLIVVGVTSVVNGAGEAITSLFWRVVFAIFSLAAGIGVVGSSISSLGGSDDTGASSDVEWEGVHVEGNVVADLIDGDIDG